MERRKKRKAVISCSINDFFFLTGKGHCQMVSIARGGLRVPGGSSSWLWQLSVSYRVAEKPGTATGCCGCHTLAQSEALTAYLVEWVSCHNTNDQPPGPHLPQGMERMPYLSLLLCPAFLGKELILCSLPLYPVVVVFVFFFRALGISLS